MPTRREFIRMAALAGPLATLSCSIERKRDALRTPKPNIILFLADDMGVGDTHVYQDYTKLDNAQQVVTPNMERLASDGVRFIHAYSPGAACAPTRRGIMMGEYMRREFGTATTLPQVLKKGGYRTYGVGKWHLPFEYGPTCRGDSPIALGPFSIGFDHYAGTRGNIRRSGAYYVDRTVMWYDEKSKSLKPNHLDVEPGYDKPGGPREEISQQLWLDYARLWISEHLSDSAQADKPFFLYYPSHANHVHHRPPGNLDGIKVIDQVKTADGRPLLQDRDDLVKPRSEMIIENDVAVGILLDWLERHDDPRNPGHKMIDNTLFVFTSDNGAESEPGTPGQGPFRGRKTNPWEAGIRVPLIARWGDRFPGGSTSNEIFSGVDFYATFAALAGVKLEPDEALDSFNLIEAMLHPDSKKRIRQAPIHIIGGAGLRVTRLGDFKAICDKRGEISDIYNLRNDIGETTNLIGNPKYAKQEAALREALRRSVENGRTRPR